MEPEGLLCSQQHANWQNILATRINYILITNFILITNYILILYINILITNFIHKILISSTCFEPQVLIFRRIQLYTRVPGGL